MTILEDLKTGRLVVVPREATPEMPRDWTEDANRENGQYLNLCSRCGWEFVGHKRRVVCKSCASPDHTAGLIALVEGVERERDEAQRLVNQLSDDITFLRKRRGDLVRDRDAAEARALAAEAERDALREALAAADAIRVAQRRYMADRGNEELGKAVGAAVATFDAIRALTQEQNNG